jgi:hypothetical protein
LRFFRGLGGTSDSEEAWSSSEEETSTTETVRARLETRLGRLGCKGTRGEKVLSFSTVGEAVLALELALLAVLLRGLGLLPDGLRLFAFQVAFNLESTFSSHICPDQL